MLKIVAPFQVKEEEDDNSISISGYASTSGKDRHGDVILPEAWKGGLKDYKNNPIVLAFHDHAQPIGKATEIVIDDKGLAVTATITKAAGNVFNLIKEGILSTFSVGFVPKDAEYDKATDIFVIKEAELYEVSVVAVPANAEAGFSVAKSFKDKEDFETFKKEFEVETQISEEILMPEKEKSAEHNTPDIDLKALAEQISAKVKSDLETDAKAKEEEETARKAEEARIEVTATTAAERLLKEVNERISEKDESVAKVLQDLSSALEEKSAEIEELRRARDGKMTFADGNGNRQEAISEDEKDNAVLLAKCLRVGVTETKYFKDLKEKSNQEHFDTDAQSGQWEATWNTRVENAMRELLVVEPVFQSFAMPTPTYHFPVNPEAGNAYWIAQADWRSADSTGDAEDHSISDHSISSFKLAAKEYVGYEEDEDSIVPLLPIIRDAVARRMARESDRAILLGEGSASTDQTSSPILGLQGLGDNTTNVDLPGGSDTVPEEDDILDARRNLGLYGINPSELVLFVSHDLYYSMMKIPEFKTVDTAPDNIATLFQGQIGSIWGIPVIVSQQFAGAGSEIVGDPCGILCRPSNFIVGQHRGLLTESDRDIEQQKNILVSSRRFGFTDIINGEGSVRLDVASP